MHSVFDKLDNSIQRFVEENGIYLSEAHRQQPGHSQYVGPDRVDQRSDGGHDVVAAVLVTCEHTTEC